MKLLVLVKVPTLVKTSGTSLIESFSLASGAIADIYSENVWESRNAWFHACIL